jgi:hypothetical protein
MPSEWVVRSTYISAVNKVTLVIQDAAAYQKLLELLEELGTVQTLGERLAAARRGEGRPVDEFFDELYERHGISPEA